MHKKHIFLRVFSKITILVCVFCTLSAWADTTTCDIDYTPVTGNSIQNGTPTPTNPVAIESVGTKVGNKYQISVFAQGKNLFDKSNLDGLLSGYVNNATVGSTTQFVPYTGGDKTIKIKVKPNTTYTVTRKTGISSVYNRFRVATWDGIGSESTVNSCKIVLNKSSDTTTPSATFTTLADTEYVFINVRDSGTVGTDWQTYIDNFMIEQGSTATPYAPYSAPITTNVYLDEPLRKVGDYADVLDYKKGQIIRNVGVKVLDGTEIGWNTYNVSATPGLFYNENVITNNKLGIHPDTSLFTHFKNTVYSEHGADFPAGYARFQYDASSHVVSSHRLYVSLPTTTVSALQTFLAQQYANGTPVTVYYPLATPVVEQIENWSCPVPITDIKIATTKFVDEEFKAAEDQLAATVQTIESVVSRTITQTEQIATLQAEKQTRPDESCPANMKCLLVQDEDGTPHWYPIIEP